MMDLTMQVINVKPTPGSEATRHHEAVADWIFSKCKLLENCTQSHLHALEQTWTWKEEILPGPGFVQSVKVTLRNKSGKSTTS